MSENNADLEAQLAQARAQAAEAEARAARAEAEAAAARLAALEAQGGSVQAPADPAQNPAENAQDDNPPSDKPHDVQPHADESEQEQESADKASAADKDSAADAPQQAPEGATDNAPDKPQEDTTPPASSPLADTISAAYAFADTTSAPTITVGTLLDGDTHLPQATATIPLSILNRHLLVAGATGSGKTRTLQLLAEGLSTAGTPVALVDVKGDLTGLAEKGTADDKLAARTTANGQDWQPASFPTQLLTPAGSNAPVPGAMVRTRVSDFGPLLLARALQLNTTQEQALQLIFSWADTNGLELVDLGDLQSVITFLTSPEGKEELSGIGGVSKATAGVILRTLTALASQGGDQFFGEPAFDTADLMKADSDGRGIISLLEVGDMSRQPALISALIMWLLADLFSSLDEVGDLDKPRLTFVFDEAHLLFTDATKEFVRQVVHTVRLIRSKGVSIVFVTQSPTDIPSDVLAQLGSRIQHALRAITPDDQRRLKDAVKTFPTTDLDLAEILTTLGTGEAVVTVLDPKGRPTPPAPFSIWAPASVMGEASDATISTLLSASDLVARYATPVDPRSATEELAERTQKAIDQRAAEEKQAELEKEQEKARKKAEREAEKERARWEKEAQREQQRAQKARERRQRSMESALANVIKSAGTQIGREITRSIFGTRRK